MKLLINTPFEIDVELVDQMPKYLKISCNWVSDQLIEVDEYEMSKLLSYLTFSSLQFNRTTITQIDDLTISWG